MKFLKQVAVSTAAMLAMGAASADVVSLYGDIDGASDFAGFAGTITDTGLGGQQSWTQTFAAPSSIASATIEVGFAALGFYSPNGVPRLFIDGILVGNLTDMDACDGSAAPGVVSCGYDNYKIDVLSISSLASLADGSANVFIETYGGDGWLLDYSKITIVEGGTVPEPNGALLAGIALLGAGVAAKRKRAA